MIPYGILYRDTVSCINEGADIWHKKTKAISTKYFVSVMLILSLLIAGVNGLILLLNSQADFISSVMFTVVEIISVAFLIHSTLKRNIRNVFSSAIFSKNLKQALLRQEDIEFSTGYSKSNYFYDEIECVVEGIYSLNIIIEKGNLPVCISKTDIAKGDIEKFIFLLKEKMSDRYFIENKIGGKLN